MARQTQSSATQDFVPIEEIRGGVVILKDKSLRAVLMASSINLALKSQNEQESVLFQFQNFLNSLDFSVQFFIQSRELDIRPYIALLEEKLTTQSNDLMKIQTQEYINFVRSFTEGSDIMSKAFFVVIPYTPAVLQKKGGLKAMLPGGKKKDTQTDTDRSFQENISQLEQRVGIVEQGLMRTGVKVARLGTEELIELYYKIFNPGDLEKPISLK